MYTCTQLHDDDNSKGVGAPVAQGGIGHRALKYIKITGTSINIKALNCFANENQ